MYIYETLLAYHDYEQTLFNKHNNKNNKCITDSLLLEKWWEYMYTSITRPQSIFLRNHRTGCSAVPRFAHSHTCNITLCVIFLVLRLIHPRAPTIVAVIVRQSKSIARISCAYCVAAAVWCNIIHFCAFTLCLVQLCGCVDSLIQLRIYWIILV